MASRAGLNEIKTAVKNLLDSANTTTAIPIDLSSNLSNSKRVLQVLKLNPERIRPDATLFPLVTCYIENKSMKRDDIAKSQLNSSRRSTVTMVIVGSVWNDTFVSIDNDPADEDINYLMENVELILRSNPTLENTVTWQKPIEVSYYTTVLDEQTHLRSGVLKLECEIFY